MKYLKIKSKGTIQTEAFTLIGASTKRDNEKLIGQYGSGNKYAISSLMRNNLMFSVFSGENEIKFTTKTKEFRGHEYQIILVNGIETSLTTTMGGDDWDNSFAYIREIYSNALDEDEDTELSVTEDLKGELGYTCFYIQYTKDVRDFYKNIGNYFCLKNPNVLHTNNYGSIYPNEKNELRLFRKGILCFHSEKEKSIFNYNGDFEINESRVLNNEYAARYVIGSIWQKCEDEKLIKTLLMSLHGGNSGTYEHKMEFYSFSNFSESWDNVVSEMKFASVEHMEMFEPDELKGRVCLPFSLLKRLRQDFPHIKVLGVSSDKDNVMVLKEPSDSLVNKVLDALSILYSTDYKDRFSQEPNIKYVRFDNSKTLAQAENGIIYLSTKLDVYSIEEIAKIIIEENEHNITGFSDKTREFQNHLFNLYFDKLTSKKTVI